MPKQIGGTQTAFVQLKGRTLKGVERAIAAVEKAGGRALHAYPPRILIAEMPAAEVKALGAKAGIGSVNIGALSQRAMRAAPRGPLREAMAAWNSHLDTDRLLAAIASPELDKSWDAPGRQEPHPPRRVRERIRRREQKLMPSPKGRALVAGAPNLSIPVLVGRIAVGVVYVDSTVAQYAISNAEKSKIVSETTEGLNMLSAFEPKANIQWFYNFQRPKISLTASQFPAGQEDTWENKWRNAAMGKMGYSADIAGMKAYIQKIKTDYNADWAYALFVTKYPKDWFAYYWGNHVVMDFTVDGWGIDNFSRVVAHETGHVFGCPDEYSSSGCNCTSKFGRYQIANGNCESCASPLVPCLMRANTPAVCDYTRGHLGWNELAIQSSGVTTLKGTWTFDFDAGIQGPPAGADAWWEQIDSVNRLLVPQSGAMLAHMGKPNFDAVSRQTLQSQAFTATPINGSNTSANKLTAGTVVAIRTGAGRFGKMKVDSYGYNLGMRWVTYK